MRMNRLGRTGLFVSELCLGTMTFGGTGEVWSKIGALQADEAEALLRTALDRGVNFVDTADVYSGGLSEEITGAALKRVGVKRSDVVVATKAFGPTGDGANARGASRLHLIEACKASLRRLGTDYIDLYQIHGFDPATPMEETLRALDTLVSHGHVRYVGVSNWAAWQVAKALGMSERLGVPRLASLQAYYTVAGRDLERELVPMMRSEEVGLMVWSPLAGGFLSGKYAPEGASEQGSRRQSFDFPPVNKDRAFACVEAMRPIAAKRGASVARIALAWLLHQRVVTSVIVGAKRVDQLEDNLAATAVELDAAEMEALEAVSALPREYPGWMFERQGEYRRMQLDQPARAAAR